MENFDLTTVWASIVHFFERIYNWMILHGIRIGDFHVSFFALGLSLLCITVMMKVLVPWYQDDDEDGDIDIGYYDNDDD